MNFRYCSVKFLYLQTLTGVTLKVKKNDNVVSTCLKIMGIFTGSINTILWTIKCLLFYSLGHLSTPLDTKHLQGQLTLKKESSVCPESDYPGLFY